VSVSFIEVLAETARTAREKAGLKQVRIAAALNVDQSTVYRFEQGRWPRDPEAMIRAYAEETETAESELWREAVKRWEATNGRTNRHRGR
jgi:transcriptional regulator with XRE-family HTH domain